MTTTAKHLFQPLKINTMTLQNRFLLPAMVTRLSGEDGYINKDIMDRYLRYAKGEVGLIVVEAMAVHSAKSGPLLRLSNDTFIEGHRELARRVHEISPSKIVPQIIHFLKVARSGWRQLVSDLSIDDIKSIVRDYGAAALRAREAGYDGVELHMAHAYTLSSFLSTHNMRHDEYGGSLENRLRLPCEVLTEVRRQVGKDFPVGIRFLGEECIKDGFTVAESKKIALRFAKLGADYISLSAGGKFEDAVQKANAPLYPYTGYSGERCMPGRNYPDLCNLYMPAEVKSYLNKHGYNTPVVAAGKISTTEQAEKILATGSADLVGLARPLLIDPDLPRKLKEGHGEKIVRCSYVNVCKNLDENFKTVRCFYWPKAMIQAPESSDTIAPHWEGSADVKAEYKNDKVALTWNAAKDNEGIYLYDIYRSVEGQPFEHHHMSKYNHFYDTEIVGGDELAYYVVARDFAGNCSEKSETVKIAVPEPEYSI
jgi:2,4-dienoyl-CoA reductase-like NADH-dependent reductase (Old Yellow Enzyme family)